MPAPTSPFSTDYWLYKYIYTPLASKLCFVDPNIVSIICFFFVFPLIYGLTHGWSLWILIIFACIREALDCMDGAIARACDRKSDLGALLDYIADIGSLFLLWGVVLWIIMHKRSISTGFIYFFASLGLVLVGVGICVFQDIIQKKPPMQSWANIFAIFHNNSVLSYAALITLLKYIVDY